MKDNEEENEFIKKPAPEKTMASGIAIGIVLMVAGGIAIFMGFMGVLGLIPSGIIFLGSLIYTIVCFFGPHKKYAVGLTIGIITPFLVVGACTALVLVSL